MSSEMLGFGVRAADKRLSLSGWVGGILAVGVFMIDKNTLNLGSATSLLRRLLYALRLI
jgi:hypothetical protein